MEGILTWIDLAFQFSASSNILTSALEDAIAAFEEVRVQATQTKLAITQLQDKAHVSSEEMMHSVSAYRDVIKALNERKTSLLTTSLDTIISALETGSIGADFAKDLNSAVQATNLDETIETKAWFERLQGSLAALV